MNNKYTTSNQDFFYTYLKMYALKFVIFLWPFPLLQLEGGNCWQHKQKTRSTTTFSKLIMR